MSDAHPDGRRPDDARATSSPRPAGRIAAELDEVRRHLQEAPPHHGAGVRRALQERLVRLERELAAARGTEHA